MCASAFSATLKGVAKSVLTSAVAHCDILILSLLVNLAISRAEEDGVGARSNNSANSVMGWLESVEKVVSRISVSLGQVREAAGRPMKACRHDVTSGESLSHRLRHSLMHLCCLSASLLKPSARVVFSMSKIKSLICMPSCLPVNLFAWVTSWMSIGVNASDMVALLC